MPDRLRSVGEMRWPLLVALRAQSADSGTAIAEAYTFIEEVFGSVEPVGASTYFGAIAVDVGLTHWIETRWLDYLDLRHVFVRGTLRHDGTVRGEIFRIRKVGEKNGRKRRVICGCELERRDQ